MLKPKSKGEPKTELVAGKVSATVKQAFQALCASIPTTESDAIAQLIERALDEAKQDQEKTA